MAAVELFVRAAELLKSDTSTDLDIGTMHIEKVFHLGIKRLNDGLHLFCNATGRLSPSTFLQAGVPKIMNGEMLIRLGRSDDPLRSKLVLEQRQIDKSPAIDCPIRVNVHGREVACPIVYEQGD